MIDFMYFIKMLALTVAIVIVMQLQVGTNTLETHALNFVQSSAITGPLHGAARGAAKVTHDISHKVADMIHHNVNKNKKDDSRLKSESPFPWHNNSAKPVTTDED
jgi:hypothetical protein